MMSPPGAVPEPALRKPSQSYVDSYIARRGDASITSPRGSACGSASRGAPATPSSNGVAARRAPRIFYPLEDECPAQYYPMVHEVNPRSLAAVRRTLFVLCFLQVGVAFAIMWETVKTQYDHDTFNEYFALGVAALCAFAGIAGFVGVCSSSRAMLLFFYINQLWGLSNVSTFAVLQLHSGEQSMAACRLYRAGDLSTSQLLSLNLDCDGLERANSFMVVGMAMLISFLWVSCFFSKTYAEMLQDAENDEDDKAMVNFIWQRRGETWVQLRRFEDVVQRQFEELRMSLVSRQAGPRAPPRMSELQSPPPSYGLALSKERVS